MLNGQTGVPGVAVALHAAVMDQGNEPGLVITQLRHAVGEIVMDLVRSLVLAIQAIVQVRFCILHCGTILNYI